MLEYDSVKQQKGILFRRWNILFCLLLSGIIALVSFVYTGGDYYSVSGGNPSIILAKLPIFIILGIFNLVHLGNVGFIIGFGALFFFPVINFVFWFVVFYYQIILVDRKTKSENMVPSFGYIIPIFVTLVISYSAIFLASNGDKMEACISGKYKMDAGFGPLGPSSCMRILLEEKVDSEKATASELIDMCLNLSDVKRVNAFDEKFPVEYETYQEYCLDEVYGVIVNAFGPEFPYAGPHDGFLGSIFLNDDTGIVQMKRFDNATLSYIDASIAKKLCDEVGSRTNSNGKKQRCLQIVGLNSDINYFESGKQVSRQFPHYNGVGVNE